ncbi:hypothetical protein LTR17_004289 [Elasticomyces elasticus]|nr:hypothetical protein LTR17_004289 [Elasticomyces elasticus]
MATHKRRKLITEKPKGQQRSSTNQTQSALLSLPPEVRNRIYFLVLEGCKLHVECVSQTPRRSARRRVYLCQHGESDEERIAWVLRERKDDQALTSHSEAHDICRQRSISTKPHITLGFLQVCRQIHQEAALIPFTSNHFIFGSGGSLLNFTRLILLTQARALRHITLVARSSGFENAHTHGILASKMRGIEKLTIFLEMWFGDHLTRPQKQRLMSKLGVFKSLPLESLAIVGYNAAEWTRPSPARYNLMRHRRADPFRLPVAPIAQFETAIKQMLAGTKNQDDKDVQAGQLAGVASVEEETESKEMTVL